MSEPRPRAILFDLDDTILEFDGNADRVWRSVVTEHAGSLAGLDVEQFIATLNEYREWYWGDPERHRRGRLDLPRARREVVRGAFDLLGLASSVTADAIAHAYSVQRELEVRPFPGAIETLNHVRAKDIRMALVTNGTSAMQRGKIERFGLESRFDYILIEEEFGVGRVYLHAIGSSTHLLPVDGRRQPRVGSGHARDWVSSPSGLIAPAPASRRRPT